jgi:hypothetical protein
MAWFRYQLATNAFNYRLDAPSARAFLGQSVTLP